MLCCLLSGAMTDRIGRKKTLLLTGIPNAAGWILIAISSYVTAAGPSVFKVIILTGRFLTGVACSGIFAAGTVSPVHFLIGSHNLTKLAYLER